LKSSSQEFDKTINQAAGDFGVDPNLIKAVISVESNGNPRALSPAGAQGLMQLMPKTAAELGVTDPFDPVQNIRAGTRYLSQLQNRYQGDLKLTLAAYNWGMGNLERKPDALPRETRNYILQVEKRYLAYADSTSTKA
jgi:soluble lytic murein transglycosylase-like protein